jgi:hypothetical protein
MNTSNTSNTSSTSDLDHIFGYLAETDVIEREPYDAVIGFGMFDLALPRFCGELYTRGLARRIVFTGGIGAGTGDLGGPEADVWRRELRQSHPGIADDAVVLENQSTNTGENVSFTAARLRAIGPECTFGVGIRRVLVVASPTRMRRVWLTIQCQQQTLQLTRTGPMTSRAADAALYGAQGIDHAAHMCGELDRIVAYAERGWVRAEPLPQPIEDARRRVADARR